MVKTRRGESESLSSRLPHVLNVAADDDSYTNIALDQNFLSNLKPSL